MHYNVSLLADVYFFFAMYVPTASKLRLGNLPERQSDLPFGSLEKAAHSFTLKGIINLQCCGCRGALKGSLLSSYTTFIQSAMTISNNKHFTFASTQ